MITDDRITSYIHSLAGNDSDICMQIEHEALSEGVPIIRKEMGCSPADYRKWYKGINEECPVAAANQDQGEDKAPKKSGAAAKGKNVPSYLL